MPDRQISTVANGVTREHFHWGYILSGRRDALISAGVAHETWFPGDEKDKRGRVMRSRKLVHDGRQIICRIRSKLRFDVYVNYSDEDKQRIAQREDFERAIAYEREEIAGMPQDHAEYRHRASRFMAVSVRVALQSFCEDDSLHGYRYAPEAVAEMEDKVRELLEILETGRTLFSAAARNARLAEIKARSAQADPGLRSFLELVTAEPRA